MQRLPMRVCDTAPSDRRRLSALDRDLGLSSAFRLRGSCRNNHVPGAGAVAQQQLTTGFSVRSPNRNHDTQRYVIRSLGLCILSFISLFVLAPNAQTGGSAISILTAHVHMVSLRPSHSLANVQPAEAVLAQKLAWTHRDGVAIRPLLARLLLIRGLILGLEPTRRW